MSTQQDIYAAGSENRPSMLNKENYVPWSSRLLRYAKSRPNGKLIYNSIMNGPVIATNDPETSDTDREMEADDQAIQTILLGLPEDIYVAVDSCETAQEIWLRVQQMMKDCSTGKNMRSRQTDADGLELTGGNPVLRHMLGRMLGNKMVYNAVQQNVGNQVVQDASSNRMRQIGVSEYWHGM
ncbi:hypothetical protein Tco_0524580 [Tanacetum coccineum]